MNHAVGEYNIIGTEQELLKVFSAMEVTLFRQDRQCWRELQDIMMAKFSNQQLVVLHGKPKKNKWVHVSCRHCGAFAYAPFPKAGDSRHVDRASAIARSTLFTFFMIPHRPLQSFVLPEV